MKPIKPLILICSGLMATASLMGTIDFAKASKNGELKNLYKDGLEPLAAISLLNNEQLRIPPPPPFFSRAPIGQRSYTESEYQAKLKAANEENDKQYKDQQARAKIDGKVANKKKMQPPHRINFSSFSRGDLRTRKDIKSKEEEIPNDK